MAIFKAGVTYTKPLEDLVANLEIYSQPLETLNDQKKVSVSICLLESVQPILTNKSTTKSVSNEEKCEIIFKSLSKSFLKGLKLKSIDLEPNLIVGGLSVLVDIQCCQKANYNLKLLKVTFSQKVVFFQKL